MNILSIAFNKIITHNLIQNRESDPNTLDLILLAHPSAQVNGAGVTVDENHHSTTDHWPLTIELFSLLYAIAIDQITWSCNAKAWIILRESAVNHHRDRLGCHWLITGSLDWDRWHLMSRMHASTIAARASHHMALTSLQVASSEIAVIANLIQFVTGLTSARSSEGAVQAWPFSMTLSLLNHCWATAKLTAQAHCSVIAKKLLAK